MIDIDKLWGNNMLIEKLSNPNIGYAIIIGENGLNQKIDNSSSYRGIGDICLFGGKDAKDKQYS